VEVEDTPGPAGYMEQRNIESWGLGHTVEVAGQLVGGVQEGCRLEGVL